MAYDDRYDRDHDRPGHSRERDSYRREMERGGRPERLGQRNDRHEMDDPDYGSERYGAGQEGFSSGGMSSDPDSFFGAPGYDASFGGPRFDRQDVGSTGTHGVHPVSSPYGADYQGGIGVTSGGGYSSSARRYAQIQQAQGGSGQAYGQQNRQDMQGGGRRQFDPHYQSWRESQIQSLDRDYEDYCREHQSRFEQEFGSFRERRGQQRASVGRVREHMEVVGSDGEHVGTVDGTKGDQIVLTRSDQAAGGRHHHIPCSWIETVDDKVRLNLDSREARRRWTEEDQSGAFFDRGRQSASMGGEGPHILNRSFAGTYDDEEERNRRR